MARNDQEGNWRMARSLVAMLILQIIETEDIMRGTGRKVRNVVLGCLVVFYSPDKMTPIRHGFECRHRPTALWEFKCSFGISQTLM